MAAENSKIVYTLTDEAPFLATASFLPIIRTFAAPAGIDVVSSDISVAARILGEFSDLLPPEQRTTNNLAELGKLTLKAEANIIKLPNISASVGQLCWRSRNCSPKAMRCLTTQKTPRPTKKRH
jgi:isocitrate dehydrogenase